MDHKNYGQDVAQRPLKERTGRALKNPVKSSKQSNKKRFIFGKMIFLLIGISFVYMVFKRSKVSYNHIIVQELSHLKKTIEDIHHDCQIKSLQRDKNYIDFLTVREFVGSQVGSLYLAYPRNWKGPYVSSNPSVQEKEYILLKNKSGMYIVPGDGVILDNGKVIGKDIIIDADSDMVHLMQDENALKSSEGVLAVQLAIDQSFLKKIFQMPTNLI